MSDKIQKRMIYAVLLLFSLYFVGFSIFSSNEKAVSKLSHSRYIQYQESHRDKSESFQEVYEAKYVYNKDGNKQTLVAVINPQNPNLPENCYGTIEERAAQQIKSLAESEKIQLEKDFEQHITIGQIYMKK